MTEQEQAEAIVKGILSDEKPKGALYQRPLGNGLQVVVFPLTFGRAALHLCKLTDDCSDSVYDFEDTAVAMSAAAEWNGEGDPADGWVRHWPSGRRRPDGTPASEKHEP